jgi:hypothetical protein
MDPCLHQFYLTHDTLTYTLLLVASSNSISALKQRVAAIELRGKDGFDTDAPPVDWGWAKLHRRVLHEWFSQPAPCLCVLADLARRAVGRGYVFWVGRACWPHPRTLIRGNDCTALQRSVLIDPTPRERLWAMDLVMRSPAAAVVVADASGLDIRATRRLQLAAEHGRTLTMLSRPPNDLGMPSVATYRWRVEPVVSPSDQPRWAVQLLRCKDARYPTDAPRSAVLEWNDDTGLEHIPAVLADRMATTTPAPKPAARRRTG